MSNGFADDALPESIPTNSSSTEPGAPAPRGADVGEFELPLENDPFEGFEASNSEFDEDPFADLQEDDGIDTDVDAGPDGEFPLPGDLSDGGSLPDGRLLIEHDPLKVPQAVRRASDAMKAAGIYSRSGACVARVTEHNGVPALSPFLRADVAPLLGRHVQFFRYNSSGSPEAMNIPNSVAQGVATWGLDCLDEIAAVVPHPVIGPNAPPAPATSSLALAAARRDAGTIFMPCLRLKPEAGLTERPLDRYKAL